MKVNSRDLFYVRYLQLRTSNVRKQDLFALFVFEKELFKYYPKTEEKILSKIKPLNNHLQLNLTKPKTKTLTPQIYPT